MGDICIDLAVHRPDDNNDWLLTAKETLDEAYTTTLDMHKRGYTIDLAIAAKALLRSSELPRWGQAINNETPTPSDYLAMLELSEKILPLTKASESRDLAASSLREFMPLLLGARATALGLNGWQGRLSLEREDCRPLNQPGFNPNWDTGIMATPSAKSFTSPEYLLQIKTTDSYGVAESYRQAGVVPISAKAYGFYDFAAVIAQANIELEVVTAGRPFSPVTQQLNSLTGKLRDAIREPLPR